MTDLHPDVKILDWNTHGNFQAPAFSQGRNPKGGKFTSDRVA